MGSLLHSRVVDRASSYAVIQALLFLVIFAAPALVQAAPPSAVAPDGYGWMLLRMVLMLAVVCAVAYAVLKWGLKRFVARDAVGGHMEVVARLAVEPRRSILVVRVGRQHLIVASSEAGMQRLGELDPDEVAQLQEPEGRGARRSSFAEVMRRGASAPGAAEGALEVAGEGEIDDAA